MAKKESTFPNMLITLLVITFASATSLGYVYELTKEPIAQAKLNKKIEAIKQVVPTFDNNPNDEMYEVAMDNGFILELYPAKMQDSLVGTAVKTFTKNGFSGEIWLMVGFTPDGSIIDVSVLEHKETPGLGTKMAEPTFKDQFKIKNPTSYKLSVKKDGGDVDAITAATISSRAFCDAVDRAHKALLKGDNQ
ncbi:MAG: RnfABCDGE type electron transport complex subunit G [Salinivirgaceae bacterium]|nr:RnfABCDGE type electron transport complex subunit G [Salinivirgaceae bacterium]MDD4745653.1 RnfABCDGE type electron transport complex subunit G [Salinivirgaceae bacterium]MDY0279301.1 RnfABCDGE type electron transport complex subunit G [Salinivirgaceae bacterium]